ncbi:MAG: PEP-CTERM sorting domain-containing protein [Acidobacteriota bacterium]
MKKLLTLTALTAAFSAASYAAIITPYSTAASFNASSIVGGSATFTENFNTNTSLFSNIIFTGGVQGVNVRDISGGVVNDQVDDSPVQSTLINLKNSATLVAAGADWNLSPGGTGRTVVLTVNLLGGGTQIVTTLVDYNPAGVFFGFTSDTAFTSFTLTSGTATGTMETYSFDNLLLEQSPAGDGGGGGGVPEPSTFGLIGIGMVGLGIARRFRR